MASPFPGMDPYLEGHLWADVHQRLSTKISQQLASQVQPKYVARLEVAMIEDKAFQNEISIMYPDVGIVRATPYPQSRGMLAEPVATVAPLTITVPKVKQVTVEIRTTKRNQLVTAIEILSPANKHGRGLDKYRSKHDRIREANVHLMEIDLIRRGQCVWEYDNIPDVPYMIALTRADANVMELWPIKLADKLPVLPVPLWYPDKEVILDLSKALHEIYEEAYYHLSIDYQKDPPPPTFLKEDREWIKQICSD
ncbi:MAG: hypothetical protein B6242_13460 [Anaerolineaceae bacterium 4572_78]|nr:MAG: hypothetical protein B6242_13460 [Anaerolineaceae bacterium 4572_78]